MARAETVQLTEIGRRIAEARRACGLTQRALAEEVGGVSLGQIDAFESGRSDPSKHLPRLAEVTGRSSQWLLTAREDEADTELLAGLEGRIHEARDASGRLESDIVDDLGIAQEDSSDDAREEESSSATRIAFSLNGSEDELDRLFVSLAHQRDALKWRDAELQRREQQLQKREADVDELEQLIRDAQEEFEGEWDSRLRELEQLHRSVVDSAGTFAARAGELRRSWRRPLGEATSTVQDEQHSS